MEYEVEGYRPRGRSKRTWRGCAKNCQAYKLYRKMLWSIWKKLMEDGWWSG